MNLYCYGLLFPMLSEIQISISEVGLSEKEWLLGSHCHDSEGTSNSRRNESLIIAKIRFSLSLKMSLFSYTDDKITSSAGKSLQKNTSKRLYCVSSQRNKGLQMLPRCGWGNAGRSPYNSTMIRYNNNG